MRVASILARAAAAGETAVVAAVLSAQLAFPARQYSTVDQISISGLMHFSRQSRRVLSGVR